MVMNLRKYFETLQKSKLLIAVTLLLVTSHIFGQFQQFMLQGREYRQEEGKWYTFFEGRKGDQIIPHRLIVRLKDRGFIESFDFQRFNISGVSMGSPRFLEGFYVLSIAPDHDPFQIASLLQRSSLFDILEFDAIGQRCDTPNDPQYSQQWNLPHIQMPQAWDIKTGNSSIILGIIDSGIRYTHEDLDGNTWVNPLEDQNGNGKPDFSPVSQGGDLDGIDNDGNTFVDDLIGWDFAGGGNNPQPPYQPDNNPDDTDGHGTNVAGVSSAQTNNYENGAYRGIAGVSGGWGNQKGVSLMVLRDGGSDPIASLTNQAIEYAAMNDARIINISSGFWPEPTGMATAINLAVNTYGVVVCASAGNNGNTGDPSIRYPAKYSNTVAVGATDQNDNRRDYSAYGPEMNVVAPDGVPSTTMAGGYTNNVTGTSFSAPHVAGLAGLIRSINPDLSYSETVTIMENSSVDLGDPGFDNLYGYGRIDAFETLKQTPTWNNVIQNDFYGDDGGIIQYESSNFNSPYTIPNYYWQQEVSAVDQTINGIDFIFSFWNNGNTNRTRTLNLANNGNYTAIFTGHMHSISSEATAFNNQRKMVWDDTFQKYHMVYEDNGDIYYTTTTGPDNAWTPEE
jgi:subtilisin family serine protease